MTVGISTPILLTITNTGSSGSGIRCVRVQVGSTFTIASVAIVSINGQAGGGLLGWSDIWAGGSVAAFKAGLLGTPLGEGDQAVFRITGTAATTGGLTWTADAADDAGLLTGTSCGSNPYPTRTIPLTVNPVATPTPPTPTPPTPTPPSTPTPQPTATPTAGTTPAPGATPSPTPRPTATLVPGTTPVPQPTPYGTLKPGESSPPLETVTPSPSGASPTPGASRPPADAVATPRPGTGGGSNGGGGNLTVGIGSSGGGSGSRPGGADVSVHGIDGAVMSALEQLPGGILFFTGPALVLTLPGLLVILAVGAQAFGALAWLPIARRKLGGFGLVRSAEERRGP